MPHRNNIAERSLRRNRKNIKDTEKTQEIWDIWSHAASSVCCFFVRRSNKNVASAGNGRATINRNP
jgi:hypothetical protein